MTDIQYSFKKKMMAWILSICLVVTLIPNIGYAANNSTTSSNNEAVNKSALDSIKVISEDEVTEDDVIAKTEDTTTYTLGGGEQMSVFHGGQVRYENENGKLVDYDPSLVNILNGEKSDQNKDLSGYSVRNKNGDKK